MSEWTEFHVDDIAQVKLTPYGKECLRANYDHFWGRMETRRYEFKLPPEDKDGWSTWHLWDLMGQLGKHMGAKLPVFLSTIRLKKDAPP